MDTKVTPADKQAAAAKLPPHVKQQGDNVMLNHGQKTTAEYQQAAADRFSKNFEAGVSQHPRPEQVKDGKMVDFVKNSDKTPDKG
jgi:hypothetical protein